MGTTRRDDSLHLRILEPHEQRPLTPEEIVRDVLQMIGEALQARTVLVSELGEGVEFEARLACDRLQKYGVDADLSAIRIGEYFKRMTEFNLLQRVHRAITSRVAGTPNGDQLNPEPGDA